MVSVQEQKPWDGLSTNSSKSESYFAGELSSHVLSKLYLLGSKRSISEYAKEEALSFYKHKD